MASAEVYNRSIGMFWRKAQDRNGQTALHIAACFGNCETICYLVKKGAGDLDPVHIGGGRSQNKLTPLHDATTSGHVEACRILVSFGFHVDCHTPRGRTPLIYAANGNHFEVVRYLVFEGGANINEKNENGASALYIASQESHIETMESFMSLGLI
uniref:Ankyrinlike protein putative n=1 Tax=Albugo laibachii Nc14 TaxID=890382 RepID=F0WRY2_9STRA|nr:ankyrinlike protein putative [Albugo laibachii Nc14]|eukprot:CCA24099.1 ankyrinlike protein putative [Albugo laibachii Nc14]